METKPTMAKEVLLKTWHTSTMEDEAEMEHSAEKYSEKEQTAMGQSEMEHSAEKEYSEKEQTAMGQISQVVGHLLHLDSGCLREQSTARALAVDQGLRLIA